MLSMTEQNRAEIAALVPNAPGEASVKALEVLRAKALNPNPVRKDALTQMDRWKRGGSIVRVSADFLLRQNARNRRFCEARGIQSVWPDHTTDTLFVVIDLQERKSYTDPDSVGVTVCTPAGKPVNGLSCGIPLAAITEVVRS